MRALRRGRAIRRWTAGGWLFLVAITLFACLPMLWMLVTSLKTQFAALQYPPEWIPSEPTLEEYRRLLSPENEVGREFLIYLWNSVLVSAATTVLGVVVAVLGTLVWRGTTFAWNGRAQVAAMLGDVSMAWVFAAIPIGSLVMLLVAVELVLRHLLHALLPERHAAPVAEGAMAGLD